MVIMLPRECLFWVVISRGQGKTLFESRNRGSVQNEDRGRNPSRRKGFSWVYSPYSSGFLD